MNSIKLSKSELTALRKDVETICKCIDVKEGYRTQNRYGVFNSLYEWNYDFLQEDFAEIMNTTELLLTKITGKLSSTF